MPRLANGTASRRDVENELYTFGCDLVEAASAISGCVADEQAARAVPALLGCVEAALEQLSTASAALRRANAASTPDTSNPRRRAATDRLDRGYANLGVALQDARDASRAARSLAARHVAMGADRDRPRD